MFSGSLAAPRDFYISIKLQNIILTNGMAYDIVSTMTKKEEKNIPSVEINLILREDLLPVFSGLLGSGFRVEVITGKSVKAVLCEQLGIESDYVNERIQTLFIDGQVVDDVDVVIVRKGATLALSGAMPGLVGATLRKGGHLAPMRASISKKVDEAAVGAETGRVKIKLFNLTARELGPGFLIKGVEVDGTGLRDLMEKMPARFFEGVRSVRVNGDEIRSESLVSHLKGAQVVRLKVESA